MCVKHTLSPFLYADEAACVAALAKALPWDDRRAAAIEGRAKDLIRQIRAWKMPAGQLESFLRQYSLTTDEGIALMCLAEALLRIPDAATANALIQDKVAAANWLAGIGDTKDWVVKAAGVGLLVTRHTLDSALKRIGQPFIREAMLQAMRIMGQQFVLGTDIHDAVENAKAYEKKGYSLSYDILGEGARTQEDADRYFRDYMAAIEVIGRSEASRGPNPPGMSIKLSALHPRYEFAQQERCVPVLTERLRELCHAGARHNMAVTVDAEEVRRLELSLQIMNGVMADPALKGWEGFGLAAQAYQKRAFALIDRLADMAKTHKRRLRVRLVKGAYWDSEIKRAQVLAMPDYPVFTRKVNTDLSYLACAHKMLQQSDAFYPMFATHNAYTVSAILNMAGEANRAFEFQRLYGMGEALYGIITGEKTAPVSIYAPVGPHQDLLAYLVRRLLENGANSSFVNRVLNPEIPVETLIEDPVRSAANSNDKRHPRIVLPQQIFAQEKPYGRANSNGLDLADAPAVESLLRTMKGFEKPYEAAPLIGGKVYKNTTPEACENPSTLENVGKVWSGNEGLVEKAFRVAGEGFERWVHTPAKERADALNRYADLLETHGAEMMALCVREAGKTIPDALAELREAVDFARYYANRGRADFARAGHDLPGPTGESNVIRLHGRGVFVCISPWNFPLAIFSGQVTAALMAGNAVIAKPASPTPLIAMRAVQLMHAAGIPKDAVNLMPGSGRLGGFMVAHKDVAGVAFTGSTEVAWEINKTLAAKRGPIVPLIAETGGQNAMIVDSSALPEQVVDDAILSAFGSAGQRCSALRILCLQEDIADKVIAMLKGAMAEMRVGPSGNLDSDIGPVIDENARGALVSHREHLKGFAALIAAVPMDEALKNQGYFFAPCAYEIKDLYGLKGEVFGPVLHVVRYKKNELGDLIDQINAQGFGLTLGVHSRIDAFQDKIAKEIRAGNVYINRSMIGAVVGSQPFGGQGLSGTGPKAGGPHYLPRFATEKVVSKDTTASGGNATLVSLGE